MGSRCAKGFFKQLSTSMDVPASTAHRLELCTQDDFLFREAHLRLMFWPVKCVVESVPGFTAD